MKRGLTFTVRMIRTFDTDVSKIGTTGADVNEFTDTLPNETTTYYYRVYADNSGAVDNSEDAAVGGDSPEDGEETAGESNDDAQAGPDSGPALKSVTFNGEIVPPNGTAGPDFLTVNLDKQCRELPAVRTTVARHKSERHHRPFRHCTTH